MNEPELRRILILAERQAKAGNVVAVRQMLKLALWALRQPPRVDVGRN